MLDLRKTLTGTGYAIGGIIYVIIWLAGIAIHLYTVLMAFSVKGFIAALFTLCLPVLAEVYWTFVSWQASGAFINMYSVIILAYVIIFLLVAGIAAFIGCRIKN